jgi:hypothetical protein
MESPRKDHTGWSRAALIGLRDGAEGSTSLDSARLGADHRQSESSQGSPRASWPGPFVLEK